MNVRGTALHEGGLSPARFGATPGLPLFKLLPLSFRLELLDLLLLSPVFCDLRIRPPNVPAAGSVPSRSLFWLLRAKVVPLCVWQRPRDSPEAPGLQVTQQPNWEPP